MTGTIKRLKRAEQYESVRVPALRMAAHVWCSMSRAAILEKEEEAQIRRMEPLRHCATQPAGMSLPCCSPSQSKGSIAGTFLLMLLT